MLTIRLKEEISPNRKTDEYNKIRFLYIKVNLLCENILILIFLF